MTVDISKLDQAGIVSLLSQNGIPTSQFNIGIIESLVPVFKKYGIQVRELSTLRDRPHTMLIGLGKTGWDADRAEIIERDVIAAVSNPNSGSDFRKEKGIFTLAVRDYSRDQAPLLLSAQAVSR